jgi:alpha-tubulin suppressor-like RCC1 family protein
VKNQGTFNIIHPILPCAEDCFKPLRLRKQTDSDSLKLESVKSRLFLSTVHIPTHTVISKSLTFAFLYSVTQRRMKFITTFSIISVLALPLAFGRSTKSALSISSGHYHTCALEQRQGVEVSGALRCWGQDSLGQASPPPGIFKQVSSGSLLSCAIGLNSKVKCWGQIGGTPSNQGFSQISAGKSHACGLTTTGRIECWGRGDNGETNATQEQYTQVSCGSSNTCGLRLDGFVDCWGKFYGVGETVPPKNKFKQISVGSKQRACGITMHGDVECWGPSERTDLRGTREGENSVVFFKCPKSNCATRYV